MYLKILGYLRVLCSTNPFWDFQIITVEFLGQKLLLNYYSIIMYGKLINNLWVSRLIFIGDQFTPIQISSVMANQHTGFKT